MYIVVALCSCTTLEMHSCIILLLPNIFDDRKRISCHFFFVLHANYISSVTRNHITLDETKKKFSLSNDLRLEKKHKWLLTLKKTESCEHHSSKIFTLGFWLYE